MKSLLGERRFPIDALSSLCWDCLSLLPAQPTKFLAIAWNTFDLLKMKTKRYRSPLDSSKTLGYDVVYADIGGLSGAHGLLESLALLDSLSKALEPRCIVIKSLCRKRLASQLIAFSMQEIRPNLQM
jgi:hypothetical protein